ncbi:RNA polymerase sigma factor [Cellulomonas composti]|uniref:RNA polymerase sigma factor n=2 Tax=Cellulomonas composti TaxID=266130 RepID=A0A511JEG9_9CELL|nr:RNA polymerase sigma factor [Cellulomonas composti]
MLEQVAQECYPRLVARALLLTRSRPDAEDLVQDALVATFGGRARFATTGQAEQYVRRAIVTRWVDRVRRSSRERDVLDRVAHDPTSPLVAADASSSGPDLAGGDLPGAVERALGMLSPRQRACVVLRHLDDLSVRETAALLGLSEGSVKRYVADGLATLTQVLGARVEEGAPVVLVETQDPTRRGGHGAGPGEDGARGGGS